MFPSYKKTGFTLIELLVVIAVLGVLAAGIFIAIDPTEKINSANDNKVQGDINQLAKAMENYAITHSGSYPANFTVLVTAGEIKSIPVAPSGYSSYSLGAGGASQYICGQLKSKKYTSAPFWVWCSTSGKIGTVTSCGSCP